MTPSHITDKLLNMVSKSSILEDMNASHISMDEGVDILIESMVDNLRRNVNAENRAKMIASINLAFDELGNER